MNAKAANQNPESALI